jgi:hypothetical protein
MMVVKNNIGTQSPEFKPQSHQNLNNNGKNHFMNRRLLCCSLRGRENILSSHVKMSFVSSSKNFHFSRDRTLIP